MVAKNLLGAFSIGVLIPLLILSSACFNLAHGTNFIGVISGDATWTQANSPYTVTGPMSIAAGATLTIQPGVTVNLGNYYIQVNGTLNAIGTSSAPIYFNGGSPYPSADLGETADQETTILFNCVRNGVNMQTATYTGGAGTLENCVFQTTSVETSPNTQVNNCTFAFSYSNQVEDPGQVVCVYGGTFANNIVYSIPGSASNEIACGLDCEGTPTVSGNTIFGFRFGMAIDGAINTGTYQDNLVYGNTYGSNPCGIQIYAPGPAIDQGFSPTVTCNTVLDNPIGIGLYGDFVEYPTISNNNIYSNSQYNMYSNSPNNFDASNNWWGSTDQQTVNQTIYDFKNDFHLGAITFVPFLTAPNSDAPVYNGALPVAAATATPTPTQPTATQQPTASQTRQPTASATVNTPEFPSAIITLALLAAATTVTLAYVTIKRKPV